MKRKTAMATLVALAVCSSSFWTAAQAGTTKTTAPRSTTNTVNKTTDTGNTTGGTTDNTGATTSNTTGTDNNGTTNNNNNRNRNNGNNGNGTTSNTSGVNTTRNQRLDLLLLRQSASAAITEIVMAQTALANSQNTGVLAFADQLIVDHSNQLAEATAVAANLNNGTLPSSQSARDRIVTRRLRRLSGDQFDGQWIRTMITSHNQALNLHTRIAQTARDEQVRAYARAQLVPLALHLTTALELEEQARAATNTTATVTPPANPNTTTNTNTNTSNTSTNTPNNTNPSDNNGSNTNSSGTSVTNNVTAPPGNRTALPLPPRI